MIIFEIRSENPHKNIKSGETVSIKTDEMDVGPVLVRKVLPGRIIFEASGEVEKEIKKAFGGHASFS